MAIKLEVGGKALVARPLVDELFFAASLKKGTLEKKIFSTLFLLYINNFLSRFPLIHLF